LSFAEIVAVAEETKTCRDSWLAVTWQTLRGRADWWPGTAQLLHCTALEAQEPARHSCQLSDVHLLMASS